MVSILLFPLSLVFLTIVKIRHFLYRIGILKSIKTERPIIVIGNINVGGTGKTPLVIWLVNFFKKQGFKPGQHFVLDQSAAKIIKKHKIPTYIIGQDLKQLSNILTNKKFKGTIIQN